MTQLTVVNSKASVFGFRIEIGKVECGLHEVGFELPTEFLLNVEKSNECTQKQKRSSKREHNYKNKSPVVLSNFAWLQSYDISTQSPVVLSNFAWLQSCDISTQVFVPLEALYGSNSKYEGHFSISISNGRAIGRNSKASVYQVKRCGNTNLVDDSCPSYADIVAGKNASSIRPSIKVHIDDNQWLLRSAVAKLPSQRSVESLREAFISDGVWNIQIRPMGDSEGKSEGEKEVNVEVEDVLVETNDLSDMGENFQVIPPIAEVAFDDGVVEVNGENDKVSTCSDKTKVEADDLVIAKESVGKNCEDPLMKDFVLDPDKVDMGSINEPHKGSNNDESGYSSPTQTAVTVDLGLAISEYSLFGSLSNYIGRKGSLMIAAIPNIIGWLAISFGKDLSFLYMGRLLEGFGVGIISYAVLVYIAEIAPQNLRGGLGSVNQLSVTIGIMLAYLLGLFVSWRILAVMGILPCLILIPGLFFSPESPRWLAKMGMTEEFEASLQVLRGFDTDISIEVNEIKRSVASTSKRATIKFWRSQTNMGSWYCTEELDSWPEQDTHEREWVSILVLLEKGRIDVKSNIYLSLL
ncbi:hypothetical protein Vadar_019603 [Vaccinium darrowii]|uniref:Uncharacterized protein n=1 Tax=Vaccinium darrowii TaxID=229202 RepID=A0ACB7YX27_9ERIC|nr:hypothetical protein Vadar_019603 [Vaccinium darrowii]